MSSPALCAEAKLAKSIRVAMQSLNASLHSPYSLEYRLLNAFPAKINSITTSKTVAGCSFSIQLR
jgi:hypothetical protein